MLHRLRLVLPFVLCSGTAALASDAAPSSRPATAADAPHLVRAPLRSSPERRPSWSTAEDKAGKEPAADRLARNDAKYEGKKPAEVKLGCRLRR